MIDGTYFEKLEDTFNDKNFKEKTKELLDFYKSNQDDANWYVECWLRDNKLPSPDTIKYNKTSIDMNYTLYGHEMLVTVTLSTTKNSIVSELLNAE